jgi:hypothetical protein
MIKCIIIIKPAGAHYNVTSGKLACMHAICAIWQPKTSFSGSSTNGNTVASQCPPGCHNGHVDVHSHAVKKQSQALQGP